MLAAIAVMCPRRPMASRGSEAWRGNEYLQPWMQESVTLEKLELKKLSCNRIFRKINAIS